jgi:endonuclease/exonuclease/phosphatase family metal-dependent hydrolase
LKLLTLNLHKGFTQFNRRFVLHELREAVRRESADLVFLQEVVGSHSGHAARHASWPVEPQHEFLAEAIWGSFAYGANARYALGNHGNALLSKHPILQWHNHNVSIGRIEQRGLLHCAIAVAGIEWPVHAICTHLGLRQSHRASQLHQLCQLIGHAVPAEAPLFVAGDFNDWRLRAHSVLEQGAGLGEAFVQLHGQAARTFPSRRPVLRLDRVYFRNAEVTNAAVLCAAPWSRLSDHAALLVEASIGSPLRKRSR